MRLIRLLKQEIIAEARSWVDDGIITTKQAEKICTRYGLDYNAANDRSYAYYVLVTLGYLFIGLAVITIVGANWEYIPRAVRMMGLILTTLGAHTFGLWKYRLGEIRSANSLFFLGSLLYGASIMLIAQIYHIGEHYPDGIFWWAIGVLSFALLLDSILFTLLSSTLGLIWFFVESSLDFFPYFFVVFLAVQLWVLIKKDRSVTIFLIFIISCGLYLEYLFSWFLGGGYSFKFGPENLALVGGYFLAFHGISKWLMSQKNANYVDYGTVLSLWVLRFGVIVLMIFSFEDPWEELIRFQWNYPVVIFSILVFFSLVSNGAIWFAKENYISNILISALFLGIIFILINTEDTTNDVVFQIFDNLFAIATGVWLILRGLNNGISHYFFMGILLILFIGFFRYIDLVGDYIGAAVLFSFFAFILLASAKYWQKRINIKVSKPKGMKANKGLSD